MKIAATLFLCLGFALLEGFGVSARWAYYVGGVLATLLLAVMIGGPSDDSAVVRTLHDDPCSVFDDAKDN